MANLDSRIIDLTMRDVISILADYVPAKAEDPDASEENKRNSSECVYGIGGIAKLLGCSKTMVSTYRKQGWIEPAIKQTGRKIVCDALLALELFGNNKKIKIN